jgi:membrane glycosyltransferase
MVVGVVSPWLAPIAASLILAIPLSALSARVSTGTLVTPQDLRPPLVAARARRWRAELRAALVPGIPAE